MRKHPLSTLPLRSGERGVALLLTLAIITLVTLLLIAFAVSMRVENSASKNFNDFIKAREIALGAVDQAVATIRQATPKRTPNLTYVTFPGAAYNYDGTTVTPKPLYSQNAADTTNLNAGLWITGNGEFSSTPLPDPSQINVGWIYIAEDGSLNPPTTLTKPLVGRFAYWVDDEASKININSAGLPAAPPAPDYGYSVSNEVDLSILVSNLNTFAPQIVSARTLVAPYTTVEEIKRADPTITDFQFTANRFSMTTYSDDAYYPNYTSDPDVFDQPRLIVSNLRYTSPADSDILGTAGGGVTNAYIRLSDAALQNVYSSISTPNAFKDKYTDVGLKQIIANIIAYQINPATTWPPDDGTAPPAAPAYLGLAKTPYISEVQVKYEITGTAPDFQVTRTVTVELFYMYDASYKAGPGPEKVVVSQLPTVGGLSDTATITVAPPITSFTAATRTHIYSSSDLPVTFSNPLGQLSLPGKTISATYTRDYSGTAHRLDFAQMTLPVQLSVTLPGTYYQDCELVGDPALNEQTSQWLGHKDGDGPRLNQPYTGYPGGDISKAVMRGDPMKSIGELGYIHLPTTPWKHLTLQPGGGSTPGQIPDWAMLDLFTVDPAVVPKVTTGRININSFINPGLATPAPVTPRLVPLKALLNSVITPPAAVAANIYDDVRTVADSYGMKLAGFGIFDTIGEICEVPGMDNGATSDADKEAVIRRIANLITVRSNTFTIWVVAQSIKEPPNIPGQVIGLYQPNLPDLITGEVRAQVVVERYVDTSTTPGKVKFRTRYFRYL